MASLLLRGEDIRRVRKARGLTLDQAAKSLGTTKSAISRWEADRARPSAENARRVARWLKEDGKISLRELVEQQRHATTATSVTVPVRLTELADEVDADLPNLLATIGVEAVRKELQRLWSEQAAEAIAQHNAYFEEHGLPLAHLRVW